MDEQNIVERYVLGQLPDAERDRLEEHYLECVECLEKVRAAEGLKRGLSSVAAQEAGRSRPTHTAIPALRSAADRRWWAAAVAVALALAAASSTFLFWKLSSSERELARARTVTAELRRQLESRPRGGDRPEPKAALVVHRWDISRGGPAARQLKLPSEPRLVVLLIDIPPRPKVDSFRATITPSAAGARTWGQEGLRLESEEGLAIAVPSEVLAPGDYVLTVEALSNGRYSRWARLPFRAAE